MAQTLMFPSSSGPGIAAASKTRQTMLYLGPTEERGETYLLTLLKNNWKTLSKELENYK